VIGAGNNFVRTMAALAAKGVDPTVVDDQHGRLTFASQIAALIRHLLAVRPAPGVYNLTSAGESVTWADVARRVYELTGHDPSRVTGVSTEQYFASASGPVAPRPHNSELDLTRVRETGFVPRAGDDLLREYLGS
jgi:dTDP-4-dehydrorhamnose reductase